MNDSLQTLKSSFVATCKADFVWNKCGQNWYCRIRPIESVSQKFSTYSLQPFTINKQIMSLNKALHIIYSFFTYAILFHS